MALTPARQAARPGRSVAARMADSGAGWVELKAEQTAGHAEDREGERGRGRRRAAQRRREEREAREETMKPNESSLLGRHRRLQAGAPTGRRKSRHPSAFGSCDAETGTCFAPVTCRSQSRCGNTSLLEPSSSARQPARSLDRLNFSSSCRGCLARLSRSSLAGFNAVGLLNLGEAVNLDSTEL